MYKCVAFYVKWQYLLIDGSMEALSISVIPVLYNITCWRGVEIIRCDCSLYVFVHDVKINGFS